jgi:hypothetical protein
MQSDDGELKLPKRNILIIVCDWSLHCYIVFIFTLCIADGEAKHSLNLICPKLIRERNFDLLLSSIQAFNFADTLSKKVDHLVCEICLCTFKCVCSRLVI